MHTSIEISETLLKAIIINHVRKEIPNAIIVFDDVDIIIDNNNKVRIKIDTVV